MPLFNAQFVTDLINNINSTQNVKLCQSCTCIVPTTLGDLRMFKDDIFKHSMHEEELESAERNNIISTFWELQSLSSSCCLIQTDRHLFVTAMETGYLQMSNASAHVLCLSSIT